MKKFTLVCLCLCLAMRVGVLAQYIPTTSQPFQFAPIFNPAFSGIENFVDVKLGHRYQWTAFKDNAPQFSNLSVNFRTKQPLDLKVNALRPSRTDFTRIVPRTRLSYHGMGFNVYNEKIGPVRKFGVGTQYAVHFPVSGKINISAGAGVMYENSRLKGDELYWGENPDLDDEILQKLEGGDVSTSTVWARAGFLVYSENFYIGATYYPASATIKRSDLAFDEQYYNGSMQFGLSFPLNEDFDLRPGILALWQVDNTFVIDYMAKFYMQDRAWFGVTYRDIQAGVVSGGFNINTMFSASYSYEFALGKLRTFSGSTHELVLSGRLKNYKRLNQRTW
jgi:type IX secretion system PorP/SprF family membrane protein